MMQRNVVTLIHKKLSKRLDPALPNFSGSPQHSPTKYFFSYLDEPYDSWDSLQAIYGSKKGIVIRSSPPRSPPPPPVHENQMISSKSKVKRPMQEIIPMDNKQMAITATTVSGSKSEEPKRRVRRKRVATPSNGAWIYPQDVIDVGKKI